jgi:hypothetical protein
MRKILAEKNVNLEDSPSNVTEGDVIEALDDILFHLIEHCCMQCLTIDGRIKNSRKDMA